MMDQEQSPVKELLFDHIEGAKERISRLVSQQKFGDVIDDIMAGCYEAATRTGDREESVGDLATGVLHYLLTCALIPSQRKVEFGGTKVDIVVPDLKTLESDAGKALVICIPGTQDRGAIEARLEQLQKIQPEKQNIWLVLSEESGLENRTYVVSGNDPSFPRIIRDIRQFASVHCQNKFRILGT